MQKLSKKRKKFLLKKQQKYKVYIAKAKKRKKNIYSKEWYQQQIQHNPKKRQIKQKNKVISLVAPTDFRLFENYDNVMRYFNNASELLREWQAVCFDSRDISNLTFETVALLMTKIKESRMARPEPTISWYEPLNPELRKLFERSWFRDWVYSRGWKTKNRIWWMFNYSNGLKVDSNQIISLVELIQKISNCKLEKSTYNLINTVLTEMAVNTNEHASWQIENKIYNWWVIFMHDEKNESIKICVIDLWIGIFENLQRAWIYKKWYFPWNNTVYLKKMLSSGEFISSVKKWQRWRWMPEIKKLADVKDVNKAILITNHIFADLKNITISKKKINFQWVLYYFEINIKQHEHREETYYNSYNWLH